MNRKNILEIARALIDKVAKFNMASDAVDRKCGSAGCIAGHILWLHPKKRVGIDKWDRFSFASSETIAHHFEITLREARSFFAGGGKELAQIDRWDAAAALARYINTGKVDFKATAPSIAKAMVEEAERKFLH